MYQALYRKYRSQTFGEMVGQKVISTTLRQAVESGKISHAYLFSGPRGTGKTSAAKIFAKAMNCPNQVDGEPCNHCDICRDITNGSLEDVIEIDAASNNGVDEIREIRDKSTYAPSRATYKVYIIDEVHMLSTGAFNALLKTLEEPTENVSLSWRPLNYIRFQQPSSLVFNVLSSNRSSRELLKNIWLQFWKKKD